MSASALRETFRSSNLAGAASLQQTDRPQRRAVTASPRVNSFVPRHRLPKQEASVHEQLARIVAHAAIDRPRESQTELTSQAADSLLKNRAGSARNIVRATRSANKQQSPSTDSVSSSISIDIDRIVRLSTILYPKMYGVHQIVQSKIPIEDVSLLQSSMATSTTPAEKHDKLHGAFIRCLKECIKTVPDIDRKPIQHYALPIRRKTTGLNSNKQSAGPKAHLSSTDAIANHTTINEMWQNHQQQYNFEDILASEDSATGGMTAKAMIMARRKSASAASSRRMSLAASARGRRNSIWQNSPSSFIGLMQSSQAVLNYYAKVPPEIGNLATFDLGLVWRTLKCRPHERTKSDIERVHQQLKYFKAFEKTSSFVLTELISVMIVDEFEENSCVFKQGDAGTCWYVILSGAVELFVSESGGIDDMKHIRLLTAGAGFGDLALMSEKPRAATGVTKTPTALLRVEKETYQKIMRFIHHQDQQEKVAFIKKIAGFDLLSDNAVRTISESLLWKTWKDGEIILEEGKPCNDVHFIRYGNVRCFRTATSHDGSSLEVKVADLGQYQSFGEDVALISNRTDSGATCKANGDVTLALFATHDARTKLKLQLQLGEMYRLDNQALLNRFDRQLEQEHWERLRKKVLDKYASERLKDSHARWEQYVDRAVSKCGHHSTPSTPNT